MTIEIRRLRAEDDRTVFRSGNVELDRFFQRYAGQNQFRHHLGTTYIAVDGATILGFATVAPSELSADGLPAAPEATPAVSTARAAPRSTGHR